MLCSGSVCLRSGFWYLSHTPPVCMRKGTPCFSISHFSGVSHTRPDQVLSMTYPQGSLDTPTAQSTLLTVSDLCWLFCDPCLPWNPHTSSSSLITHYPILPLLILPAAYSPAQKIYSKLSPPPGPFLGNRTPLCTSSPPSPFSLGPHLPQSSLLPIWSAGVTVSLSKTPPISPGLAQDPETGVTVCISTISSS